MLKQDTGIYCGIFNSSILRRNAEQSIERMVECYELELFHSEAGTSYINGQPYKTRRGMLLAAKPGQRRFSIFPVKCSFIRVFKANLDPDIKAVLDSLPDITYLSDDNETDSLLALFSKLGACFAAKHTEPSWELKINGLFLELLYRIVRLTAADTPASASSLAEGTVRKAYEYIHENYIGDCRLKTIAEAISVSPNYLHTLFKSSMGITPYEYAVAKRIEKAKDLIMTGEYTMLEIALAVGFCSQSHFNKVFLQKTGMTPVEYRRSLLEQY